VKAKPTLIASLRGLFAISVRLWPNLIKVFFVVSKRY